MIYLASPYTHPDPAVRQARFEAACRQAAEMMRCGIPVFSPIAHSHPVALHGGLDALDLEFWERQDLHFVEACSEIWVLQLDGWQESTGLQAEIEMALSLGKPVMYVEADEPRQACAGVKAERIAAEKEAARAEG